MTLHIRLFLLTVGPATIWHHNHPIGTRHLSPTTDSWPNITCIYIPTTTCQVDHSYLRYQNCSILCHTPILLPSPRTSNSWSTTKLLNIVLPSIYINYGFDSSAEVPVMAQVLLPIHTRTKDPHIHRMEVLGDAHTTEIWKCKLWRLIGRKRVSKTNAKIDTFDYISLS